MAAQAKILSLQIVPTMSRTADGGFDLYWDVQTRGFTPKFQVQMAETESGTWTSLLGSTTASYSATEVGPKRLNFQTDLFFRLLVIDETIPLSPVTVLTGPAEFASFMQNRHDACLYREMLRREDLGLRKYHGQPGSLLRRIVHGTPCTVCLDETLGGSADSNCPTCFGTGFVGGYYPDVPIYVDMADQPSGPDNTVLTPAGPAEVRPCDSIFPAYPAVKFKDIFVEYATRQRHEIQSVTADEFRGSNIRQIVTLSRLQPSDIAYQVPLL